MDNKIKVEIDSLEYTAKTIEVSNKLILKLSMKNLSNQTKKLSFDLHDNIELTTKSSENFNLFYKRKHPLKRFFQYPWFIKSWFKYKKYIFQKRKGLLPLKPNKTVKRTLVFKKTNNVNESILFFGWFRCTNTVIPIHLGVPFEKDKTRLISKNIENEGIKTNVHIEEGEKWLSIKIKITNVHSNDLFIQKPSFSESGIFIKNEEDKNDFVQKSYFLEEYGNRIIKANTPNVREYILKENECINETFYFEKHKADIENFNIEFGFRMKRESDNDFHYVELHNL